MKPRWGWPFLMTKLNRSGNARVYGLSTRWGVVGWIRTERPRVTGSLTQNTPPPAEHDYDPHTGLCFCGKSAHYWGTG
jgi:hypothetical protein